MDHSLIKKADQALVGTLVVVALAILAVQWVVRGGPKDDLVNIERVRALGYTYAVDLNHAEWPELAQLPDIGEVLARRIVESRQTAGPYGEVDDLLRVEGIGPRRLERVRGYFLPLPGEGGLASD